MQLIIGNFGWRYDAKWEDFWKAEGIVHDTKDLQRVLEYSRVSSANERINKTNPSSDKILAICEALDVSTEWLLSGVDSTASRKKRQHYYIIEKYTEGGRLLSDFNQLKKAQRERVIGCLDALISLQKNPLKTEEGDSD